MKKLLIAVFIMCLAVPSYADMIVNGGFETGTNPPAANAIATLSAGNTQLTGWTIGVAESTGFMLPIGKLLVEVLVST